MTWPVGILVFLSVITIGSYLILRKMPPEKLTPVYLLSITTKIVLSCIFVIIFIMADKPAANYNTVFLLVGYIIFTGVEVIFLLVKKKG